MHRYRLAVYDMHGNQLCTLYDSEHTQDGEARDIEMTTERSGWKELRFTVPYYLRNGERNFRIDSLKNEHQLRYSKDAWFEVFSIKEDNHIRDAKRLDLTVQADHVSEELKTKNLYLVFDDENGIGKCNELIEKALANTGWRLVNYDPTQFYETGTSTPKMRSYSCDTKTGAYAMVTGICELFRARPVFHGTTKTIEVIANTVPMGNMLEMYYGRNVDKITRKLDTSKLITRLYVEGEYGDFGYVGIDDATGNTYHTPFILDFSYYQSIGVFTDDHQEAEDKYLDDYYEYTDTIKTKTAEMLEKQEKLVAEIGTCDYILAPVSGGSIQYGRKIVAPWMDTSSSFAVQPTACVFTLGGQFNYDYNYSPSFPPPSAMLRNAGYVVQFIPTITGLLGATEDTLTIKGEDATAINEKFAQFLINAGWLTPPAEPPTIPELCILYGSDDGQGTPLTIEELTHVADDDFVLPNFNPQVYQPAFIEMLENLNTRKFAAELAQNSLDEERYHELKCDKMEEVIGYIEDIDDLHKIIVAAQKDLADAEALFVQRMGSMLRDGYWFDNNYAVGQQDALYADAKQVSATMAKPIVTYNFDAMPIYEIDEFADEEWEISQRIHIYDKELGINDYVYVDKIRECADAPMKSGMEATTDLLQLGQKSFSSTIERISNLAENVYNNKDIYARSESISPDGTISSELLEGTIDTLTNKMQSTYSNWGTDERGNLVFTALDGSSAMMLCGSGFMVANGKNPDNTWRWRTFGSGEGFTADMIVAGFISTERLQAGSITTSLLASGVGQELNIQSNSAIRMVVSQEEEDTARIEGGLFGLARNVDERMQSTITMLQDQIDLRVSQGDLSSYMRTTLSGVYVGRTDSNYESVVRSYGFDIIYYENGRDETQPGYTEPRVVWEATHYGMHATQIMLDIDYGGAKSSIVKQVGTTTGGMAWY